MLPKLSLATFIFLAASASLPAQNGCPPPRSISVVGNAEVMVAPDQVSITLGVDSRNKDLSLAKAENDRRFRKILSLARAAGIEDKNIQTSVLEISQEFSEDRTPRLLGYNVNKTASLTLTDISKYEDLLSSLISSGVNRVDSVTFSLAAPQKYRAEARLTAIRAATEKAAAMAGALGQTTGKPLDITEVTDDYLNISVNSMVGNFSSRSAPAKGSTIAAGQVVIRATVRVSFQLE